MKYLIFFSIFICQYINAQTSGSTFPTLEDLDKVVAEQQLYVDKHEKTISSIRQKLKNATSEEDRYWLKNDLFSEYISYQVDSALLYAQEKLKSAHIIGKQDYIDDSHINIAYVFILAGMYKEASDMLESIDRSRMEEYLEEYYFSAYNLLYEAMLKYSIGNENKKKYRSKAMAYKDSILLKSDYQNIYIYADKLLEEGKYEQGLPILQEAYSKLAPDNSEIPYAAYLMSSFYRRMGNTEKEKQYLIISAIGDLKWGIKEYISLWRLATILFEEGDIERAYTYISRSQADASFCNARLRTIEVTQILPIVEKAYRTKTQQEHRHTLLALICSSILTVFLIILVICIRKQMKRLAAARNLLNNANTQLQRLNTELKDVNQQLSSANKSLQQSNQALSTSNKSLTEANQIKEAYITRFITECSAYIDKMNDYRKHLNKLAISGNLEDLFKLLKSPSFIREELEAFYQSFDETFLNLFPHFVEHFNQLPIEGEAIVPKKNNSLTTELRIFALIRLGISDSERIAAFLRCSKATIYSYRSRLRLKSISPENFENLIMQIL